MPHGLLVADVGQRAFPFEPSPDRRVRRRSSPARRPRKPRRPARRPRRRPSGQARPDARCRTSSVNAVRRPMSRTVGVPSPQPQAPRRARRSRRRSARHGRPPLALGARFQHGDAVDPLDEHRLHAPARSPDRPAPPAAARWASVSSVKLSSERPPRSRNHASSPSTSTTSAPALRPGRCAASSSAAARRATAAPRHTGWRGRRRPAPRPGTRGGPGRRRRDTTRSRSTVDATANCAPPSDSTK